MSTLPAQHCRLSIQHCYNPWHRPCRCTNCLIDYRDTIGTLEHRNKQDTTRRLVDASSAKNPQHMMRYVSRAPVGYRLRLFLPDILFSEIVFRRVSPAALSVVIRFTLLEVAEWLRQAALLERTPRLVLELIVNFVLGVDRHERACPAHGTPRCLIQHWHGRAASAMLAIETELYWEGLKQRLRDEQTTVAQRAAARRRGASPVHWSTSAPQE